MCHKTHKNLSYLWKLRPIGGRSSCHVAWHPTTGASMIALDLSFLLMVMASASAVQESQSKATGMTIDRRALIEIDVINIVP